MSGAGAPGLSLAALHEGLLDCWSQFVVLIGGAAEDAEVATARSAGSPGRGNSSSHPFLNISVSQKCSLDSGHAVCLSAVVCVT
jgi:hypothetical protein